MARIFGDSDCSLTILNGLKKLGLTEINSMEEVSDFKENFPTILEEKTREERQNLTLEINSLKEKSVNLAEKLGEEISNLKKTLLAEKKSILPKIEALSERESNPFKNLMRIIKKYMLLRRFKTLENNLEREAEKPFKKDKKHIKKIKKNYKSLESNFGSIIDGKISYLKKIRAFLELNILDFLGGIGEDKVMVELSKLPDSYYVINNVFMMLRKSVLWKKYREYVRSAQIDHIVIGPSGVYLIETKNWGNKTFQNSSFSPHKQIDRASLVFFLSVKRNLEGKIPTRNIVVTINRNPYLNYKYVKQVHISGLNSFILKSRSVLTISDVKRIAVRILPHCRNYYGGERINKIQLKKSREFLPT